MVTRQGSQMGGDPSSQLRIGLLLIDFYGIPYRNNTGAE